MKSIPKIYSTAYLMGGLGNQMFQISHAISQGLKNNIEALFVPVAYTPMQANQPTKYLDNVYRNINFVDKLGGYKIVESPWQFVDLNINWNQPIQFIGFYQSNKNFLGYDDNIKELFQPSEEFINKVNTLYPEINNEDTLSLHIRRGDYTKISHILPVIDKTYIDEVIRLNDQYTTLFIFSDDVEWVSQNLFYRNQIIVTDLEDYEELWLMSLCKNNIMSNSTFSWWGSFLNNNENKKVFAPSIWFGPNGEKNYYDIYDNKWIIIPTKYDNGKIKIMN
jgi:hypothetical protein